MDHLKNSRATFTGAATRVFNKQSILLDKDPETFDVIYLQQQIEAVKSSDASYKEIYRELMEKYIDSLMKKENSSP